MIRAEDLNSAAVQAIYDAEYGGNYEPLVRDDLAVFLNALLEDEEAVKRAVNAGIADTSGSGMELVRKVIRTLVTEYTRCERCLDKPAIYFLEKGIAVCRPCYNSPEDIMKELPRA